MTQRVTNVDAVLDTRGELLRLDQVGAHDLPRSIHDVSSEILDPLILRRPAALGVGVPLHSPALLFSTVGPALQLARPPDDRQARAGG